jgi:hypothetical protein
VEGAEDKQSKKGREEGVKTGGKREVALTKKGNHPEGEEGA